MGLVGQGKTRGMSALMAMDAYMNQNVAGITPGPLILPQYLHYVLVHAYQPLRELGQGGQQDALNCGSLKAFRIPVPPTAEQREIVAEIELRLSKLSSLVAAIDCQVERLREYRQALITAAVTGQIDVSSSAAQVPAA